MGCTVKLTRSYSYGFEMTENEKILHKGLANMQEGSAIVKGALYLTNERMVFVGLVPESRTMVQSEVSLFHVREVRLKRTLFIFENIIEIENLQGEVYKFILDKQKVWHAEIHKQLAAIG